MGVDVLHLIRDSTGEVIMYQGFCKHDPPPSPVVCCFGIRPKVVTYVNVIDSIRLSLRLILGGKGYTCRTLCSK